jgi:DNA-binding protein H-NS
MIAQLEYPTAVTPSSAPKMTHADTQDPDHSDTPLDAMSDEELQQKQAEIDRKLRERRQALKKAIIGQIVEVVQANDIPIEELVEALGGLKIKRKGVKATQKYWNPVTGVTWSGRGKEPSWIRGKDRKKFLLPDTQ